MKKVFAAVATAIRIILKAITNDIILLAAMCGIFFLNKWLWGFGAEISNFWLSLLAMIGMLLLPIAQSIAIRFIGFTSVDENIPHRVIAAAIMIVGAILSVYLIDPSQLTLCIVFAVILGLGNIYHFGAAVYRQTDLNAISLFIFCYINLFTLFCATTASFILLLIVGIILVPVVNRIINKLIVSVFAY